MIIIGLRYFIQKVYHFWWDEFTGRRSRNPCITWASKAVNDVSKFCFELNCQERLWCWPPVFKTYDDDCLSFLQELLCFCPDESRLPSSKVRHEDDRSLGILIQNWILSRCPENVYCKWGNFFNLLISVLEKITWNFVTLVIKLIFT